MASRGNSQTWGSPTLPGEGKPFSFNIVGANSGAPPAEEKPQEGTRGGAVSLPGILGLGFAWGAGEGAWIRQSGPRLPISERRQQPQGRLGVCTLHRNLCGCFSKKREWSSPFVCLALGKLGPGSQTPRVRREGHWPRPSGGPGPERQRAVPPVGPGFSVLPTRPKAAGRGAGSAWRRSSPQAGHAHPQAGHAHPPGPTGGGARSGAVSRVTAARRRRGQGER